MAILGYQWCCDLENGFFQKRLSSPRRRAIGSSILMHCTPMRLCLGLALGVGAACGSEEAQVALALIKNTTKKWDKWLE
jgi:hypothetical protein